MHAAYKALGAVLAQCKRRRRARVPPGVTGVTGRSSNKVRNEMALAS